MRFFLTIGIAAVVLAVGSAARAEQTRVTTRFGTLTIKGLDNVVNFGGRVFYKGHPLRPDVTGNNQLDVERTFHLAGADAVLFSDIGGEGCPYLWYIVTVTRSGAGSTPAFGSCGPLLETEQHGQTIVLKTKGFLGPFEPQAARARAFKQVRKFTYRRGMVTENGKPAS